MRWTGRLRLAIAFDFAAFGDHLPEFCEDLGDSPTGTFLLKLERRLRQSGQSLELGAYTQAVMTLKFVEERRALQSRCQLGATVEYECDCEGTCSCSVHRGDGLPFSVARAEMSAADEHAPHASADRRREESRPSRKIPRRRRTG